MIITKVFGFVFLLLLAAGAVIAHTGEDFTRAKEIIAQNSSCENLGIDDFEVLGDYFMEQMHPGEAHEIMDTRMGGEDSQILHDMHVAMGIRFYCQSIPSHIPQKIAKQVNLQGVGMMGGYGMYNMMGYSSGYGFLALITWLAVLVLAVLLIIWLIKQISRNERNQNRRKKK